MPHLVLPFLSGWEAVVMAGAGGAILNSELAIKFKGWHSQVPPRNSYPGGRIQHVSSLES